MTIVRLRNPSASKVVPLELKSPEHETPQIKNAFNRIEANYSKLDSLLSQVELKIQADPKLNEIDQSLTATDLQDHQLDKRQRRSRKPDAGVKSSANRIVRKPR